VSVGAGVPLEGVLWHPLIPPNIARRKRKTSREKENPRTNLFFTILSPQY